MKTIYLHIGTGKTGTTEVQRVFGKNQRIFEKKSLHYIRADGGANGLGHQDLAKSFIDRPPSFMEMPNNPTKLRRTIAKEIERSKAENVMLSSENFELSNAAEVCAYFSELRIQCRLKVIYFVRSQDELIESIYNQMVKLKGEARPFREFLESESDALDFLAVANRWAKLVGQENMICRVYDAHRGDILSQFLECLPKGDEILKVMPLASHGNSVSNVSVGYKALTIARLLNSSDVPNRQALLSRLFESMNSGDSPALMFDSNAARNYRSRFNESNKEFSNCYLDSQCEDLGGRRFTDEQRDEVRQKIELFQNIEGF